MKYETLLTRYKNLGYKVKGYEDKGMEIESICKWLYDNHKIYMSVLYRPHEHPRLNIKKGYLSHTFWHFDDGIVNDFFGEKTFDNPYDAKFDGLRTSYRAVKFQRY